MPGGQFDITHFPGVQGGTNPGVVFVPAQHVPDQDRKLAGSGDRGDVLPTASSDPQEEGSQRAWDARGDPSSLDQHAAGVSAASLGDAAAMHRAGSRLVHARVQPEVADQLLRAGKTFDVADRRYDADGDYHVDPGDRHEPLRLFVRQRALRQVSLDDGQVFSEPVVFSQVTFDGKLLVRRQDCFLEPRTAFWTEQVGRRAGRDEMRMQDRLHDVFQTRAPATKLVSPGDLTTPRLGPLVRHPHFRQETAGIEPGQHRGVDAVGFDLRVRDQPYLLWIGDHHATDMRVSAYMKR